MHPISTPNIFFKCVRLNLSIGIMSYYNNFALPEKKLVPLAGDGIVRDLFFFFFFFLENVALPYPNP